MKQEWLETILEITPFTDTAHKIREEGISEIQVDDSPLVTVETRKPNRVDGIVIGRLVGLQNSGAPLIDFPANSAGTHVQARSMVALSLKDIGQAIALMFEAGDIQNPIVIGLIQHPEERSPEFPGIISGKTSNPFEVQVDGERLVFTAQKEIVLRCGKASITLTRAGKVLIRGAYLLSRSSGMNRIKGGSVQIN